jgi:hypothetical protein
MIRPNIHFISRVQAKDARNGKQNGRLTGFQLPTAQMLACASAPQVCQSGKGKRASSGPTQVLYSIPAAPQEEAKNRGND